MILKFCRLFFYAFFQLFVVPIVVLFVFVCLVQSSPLPFLFWCSADALLCQENFEWVPMACSVLRALSMSLEKFFGKDSVRYVGNEMISEEASLQNCDLLGSETFMASVFQFILIMMEKYLAFERSFAHPVRPGLRSLLFSICQCLFLFLRYRLSVVRTLVVGRVPVQVSCDVFHDFSCWFRVFLELFWIAYLLLSPPLLTLTLFYCSIWIRFSRWGHPLNFHLCSVYPKNSLCRWILFFLHGKCFLLVAFAKGGDRTRAKFVSNIFTWILVWIPFGCIFRATYWSFRDYSCVSFERSSCRRRNRESYVMSWLLFFFYGYLRNWYCW